MMPRRLSILAAVFFVAIGTTLTSGEIYQRMSRELYPYSGVGPGTSWKREVVGGWPLPFLIDGYVSPVNSVSVVSGLLGEDRWDFAGLAVDVVVHFAILYGVYLVVFRRWSR